MILPYGLKNGQLIHVSEVKSGITDLQCPYCQQPLYAKKGKVIAHHFAHVHHSCNTNHATLFFGLGLDLPLQFTLHDFVVWMYQKMNLRYKTLQKQQRWCTKAQSQLQQTLRLNMQALKLQSLEHISKMEQQLLYEQIKDFLWNERQPFPTLSHAVQQQLPELNASIQGYHPNRYKSIEIAQQLALYEQDLKRFRLFSLYFIKIQSNDYHIFYKVGLTSRPIATRLSEIQTQMNTLFENLTFEVLAQLQQVAFLEPFFKQKFYAHRYPIANFTEYFVFDAFEVQQILDEFKRIASYVNQ